jgi:hypothetical protein
MKAARALMAALEATMLAGAQEGLGLIHVARTAKVNAINVPAAKRRHRPFTKVERELRRVG